MIRASQIYVNAATRQLLRLVAKARGLDNADAAGEELLSEALVEKYPALVAHQKRVKDMEAELLESIKPKLP